MKCFLVLTLGTKLEFLQLETVSPQEWKPWVPLRQQLIRLLDDSSAATGGPGSGYSQGHGLSRPVRISFRLLVTGDCVA